MKRFFHSRRRVVFVLSTVLLEIVVVTICATVLERAITGFWSWPDRIDILSLLILAALIDIANNEFRVLK